MLNFSPCIRAGIRKPQERLPDGVYRVGGNVKPPRLKYDPEPEFSEQARHVGYEGVCVLKLVVDAEGMPQNITVVRPVGMGLDDKAIAAVRQWTILARAERSASRLPSKLMLK